MSDDIIKRLRDRLDSWRESGATGLWVNFLDLAALLDRLDKADRENERLRAERDEHARWRVDLADKLHDAESQISAAWAALRHAGIQSEKTVAEAIALLHAENERLAAELANLQIAFNDWKVMHSTVRLEVENERLRARVVSLEGGLDAALDFASTVAGSSSWWDEVWPNHSTAIDAARREK